MTLIEFDKSAAYQLLQRDFTIISIWNWFVKCVLQGGVIKYVQTYNICHGLDAN